MSESYVTGIEETENEHRKRLHNLWQKAIDYANEQDSLDPFESKVLYTVMTLAQHLFGQTMRESSNKITDLLKQKSVQELKKSYEPGFKEIVLVTAQIISTIAYGILGGIPLVSGIGGTSASLMKVGSEVVKGVGEGGSHAIGQLNQGSNQGKQSLLNYELEHNKRLQSEHDQARRSAEEANRKHVEMMQRNEEKRHDTISQAARSLGS